MKVLLFVVIFITLPLLGDDILTKSLLKVDFHIKEEEG
jgi:hypothetical protein